MKLKQINDLREEIRDSISNWLYKCVGWMFFELDMKNNFSITVRKGEHTEIVAEIDFFNYQHKINKEIPIEIREKIERLYSEVVWRYERKTPEEIDDGFVFGARGDDE